ncbi:NF-kappa-B inhibitor-like protein 1 isoform X2 [Protopterus annectens]|uniref:NF-kappa-B inhibitor-like protein 1 isoform X2 n=1 Tax=Protopterus annectens TaxID=7888 RepID=UPI001CF9E5A5|nr:NF-kappa-B inhibitor-like protein 1 isoform X2 [Protopterus annectens]
MKSKKWKKLLCYIEGGNLLKLKSYLRKNTRLDVNYVVKKGRTPLHIACGLQDDAVVHLLLKYGASVLLQDNKGNTPLHVAAQLAIRKGRRVYDDLFIPLKKHCPVAMEIANHEGETPRSIIEQMKNRKSVGYKGYVDYSSKFRKRKSQEEREWQQKISAECDDEYFETYGQYEDFYCIDPEPEMYDDWAARIAREYASKRRSTEGCSFQKNVTDEERRKQEQQEFQRKLEEEHQQYLLRAHQKGHELRCSKKEQYVQKCSDIFGSSSLAKLAYSDIPWPCRNGAVEDMTAVILHGMDTSDRPAYRRYLRQQQALWHPDKFLQRCSDRLLDKDRDKILATVTALSQALNKLSEEAK